MSDAAIKALREVVAQKRKELANYEKALTLLTGMKLDQMEKPSPNGRPIVVKDKNRKEPSKVGPERLAIIRNTILDFALAEDKEFRGIDIRQQLPAGPLAKSAVISQAFVQLREEKFIRFVRKQGINKYYRLTSEKIEKARTASNGKSE